MHIFNRVFWPAEDATAQLAHDLATGLATRGWRVTVVTATPGPTSCPPEADAEAGSIQISRIGNDRRRNTGVFAKGWGYLRYLFAARRTIAQEVRTGDCVVVMTDPPLLAHFLAQPLRRAGARVFHWTQDIYPEVAVALRPFGPLSRLLNVLKPARDAAWQESERIVTLGDDMAGLVQHRGIPPERLAIVANWPPCGLAETDGRRIRTAWGVNNDNLVLCYSGNLGRAHDLTPLLDLAERLRDMPAVRLVVIGQGPQKATLEHQAKIRGLTYVRFFPPVSRQELGASLSAADMHLVTMRENCLGLVWPSKFYGIVACRRPLLFIGPAQAEIAHLIRHHNLGLAVPRSELHAAERYVRQLAADPARRLALRDQVRQFAESTVAVEKSIAAWHTLLAGASFSGPERS